jgi:hypothetical protein
MIKLNFDNPDTDPGPEEAMGATVSLIIIIMIILLAL